MLLRKKARGIIRKKLLRKMARAMLTRPWAQSYLALVPGRPRVPIRVKLDRFEEMAHGLTDGLNLHRDYVDQLSDAAFLALCREATKAARLLA